MELRTVLRFEETFAGTGLWLMSKDSKGRVFCAKRVELEFEELKDYPLLPESTINFGPGNGEQFLRGMADELVKLGFLPGIAKQSQAELSATVRHLEDMRSLVFKNNPYK